MAENDEEKSITVKLSAITGMIVEVKGGMHPVEIIVNLENAVFVMRQKMTEDAQLIQNAGGQGTGFKIN